MVGRQPASSACFVGSIRAKVLLGREDGAVVVVGVVSELAVEALTQRRRLKSPDALLHALFRLCGSASARLLEAAINTELPDK